MEWKDIWKEDPPRNEEILFLVGDGEIHIGELWGSEKLRKCTFRSFLRHGDYECDKNTDYENRVLYWCPIPEIPELKEED